MNPETPSYNAEYEPVPRAADDPIAVLHEVSESLAVELPDSAERVRALADLAEQTRDIYTDSQAGQAATSVDRAARHFEASQTLLPHQLYDTGRKADSIGQNIAGKAARNAGITPDHAFINPTIALVNPHLYQHHQRRVAGQQELRRRATQLVNSFRETMVASANRKIAEVTEPLAPQKRLVDGDLTPEDKEQVTTLAEESYDTWLGGAIDRLQGIAARDTQEAQRRGRVVLGRRSQQPGPPLYTRGQKMRDISNEIDNLHTRIGRFQYATALAEGVEVFLHLQGYLPQVNETARKAIAETVRKYQAELATENVNEKVLERLVKHTLPRVISHINHGTPLTRPETAAPAAPSSYDNIDAEIAELRHEGKSDRQIKIAMAKRYHPDQFHDNPTKWAKANDIMGYVSKQMAQGPPTKKSP